MGFETCLNTETKPQNFFVFLATENFFLSDFVGKCFHDGLVINKWERNPLLNVRKVTPFLVHILWTK